MAGARHGRVVTTIFDGGWGILAGGGGIVLDGGGGRDILSRVVGRGGDVVSRAGGRDVLSRVIGHGRDSGRIMLACGVVVFSQEGFWQRFSSWKGLSWL